MFSGRADFNLRDGASSFGQSWIREAMLNESF